MSEELKHCPPVLVRDLAEILGRAVPDVMSAFIVAGLAPRSPNMAVSGEDALAVAAVLKRQRQDCEPMIAQPTYGSEEVRKLRETIASMAKIIQAMEREQGCPPFWPVVQVLLDEYGLQLIDIVAAYKQATTDQQRQDCEPVYQYQLADGKWVDRSKRDYEADVAWGHATVRVLYAEPPKREPLSEEQIKKAAEKELDSWGMALQEARRPVHEAITSMCWRLGVTL